MTLLAVWAAIINTYILVAFLWPVLRKQLVQSPSLCSVARGSICSILVSGVCTVINLSILLILKGEHGIECLLCCSIDVLVNTLALAIVTNPAGEKKSFPLVYEHEQDNRETSQEKAMLPAFARDSSPACSPTEGSNKSPECEEA